MYDECGDLEAAREHYLGGAEENLLALHGRHGHAFRAAGGGWDLVGKQDAHVNGYYAGPPRIDLDVNNPERVHVKLAPTTGRRAFWRGNSWRSPTRST